MNIQYFLIAGMLLCACNVFAQEKSNFSLELSTQIHTNNDQDLIYGDWDQLTTLGIDSKLIFTPKKGRFSFSASIGLTRWWNNIRYGNAQLLANHYDLDYVPNNYDTRFDNRTSRSTIKYSPDYLNLSLGTQLAIINKSSFQFFNGIELVNYFKINDKAKIVHTTRKDEDDVGLFESHTEKTTKHPVNELFAENHGKESSNRIIEAQYHIGCVFQTKKGTTISLSTSINKSFDIKETNTIGSYWGVGNKLSLIYTL